MNFALNDRLKMNLLAALENQDKTFLVDAENGVLVELSDGCEFQDDEEKYYCLPEWTSDQGFKLREEFVNQVHSPLVHDELLEVLHSGRGVFRNFRNVLREYPEFDRLWLKYKNQALLEIINRWYNELREIWGLETLDYMPESDESLVHDDFSFVKFNPEVHEKQVQENAIIILNGSDDNQSEELRSAVLEMWKRKFETDKNSARSGFVCSSLSDDFAGCILVKPVSDVQENVILLTNFFVTERFRGLGIGTELLSMCISELKSRDKKWLIVPSVYVPEFVEPLLFRTGFEKTDFGYILALQNVS